MTENKPLTIEQYKKWLKFKHSVHLSDKSRNHYDAVAAKIKERFIGSAFWKSVTENIKRYSQEYFISTSYHLSPNDTIPEFATKPYDAFILKTFRINVLKNTNWPEPPGDGWLLPDNWFLRTNDIVRTYFIVKYLDGVEYLAGKLNELSHSNGHATKLDFEAKDEGYYAAHFYVYYKCEVPTVSWKTEKLIVPIEIQITTQLQEVIRKMLHNYYETKRKEIEIPDLKWQWDYRSDEFSTNYLGHILHYVEGMIMEVRNKQKRGPVK